MTEISIQDRPQKQVTLTYQPAHQKNPESERHGDPSSVGDNEQSLFECLLRDPHTITWSQPAFWIMFATSLAVIGALLLSFLSCRE